MFIYLSHDRHENYYECQVRRHITQLKKYIIHSFIELRQSDLYSDKIAEQRLMSHIIFNIVTTMMLLKNLIMKWNYTEHPQQQCAS